jgi:hypothetical protein
VADGKCQRSGLNPPIELSKKSWIVTVNSPFSDKISRYTSENCDWKEPFELSARIRTRVARELKKRVEVVSRYEAGRRLLGCWKKAGRWSKDGEQFNNPHSSVGWEKAAFGGGLHNML